MDDVVEKYYNERNKNRAVNQFFLAIFLKNFIRKNNSSFFTFEMQVGATKEPAFGFAIETTASSRK